MGSVKASSGAAAQRVVDYNALRDVGSTLLLRDVVPREFHVSSEHYLRGVSAAELSQRVAYSVHVLGRDGDLFLVSVEFHHTTNQEDVALSDIRGSMIALYTEEPRSDRSLDGFSEQLLLQFAEVNGVFNCWPYMREFISDMLGRIGISGVMLPMWRAPQRLKEPGAVYELVYEPTLTPPSLTE